jgi:rubredoxin
MGVAIVSKRAQMPTKMCGMWHLWGKPIAFFRIGMATIFLIVVTESKTKVTKNETTVRTWMCLICGWIYNETVGDPEHGIAPGTPWESVSMNWTCPECGARKEDFEMVLV